MYGWVGLLLLVACTTENQTKPSEQPGVEGAILEALTHLLD